MDDAQTERMPQGALVAAIPVLIWSIQCLNASNVWFYMQHFHSERWNYIGLMALTVSGSTIASIIQQIWYICHWRHDRTSEWEQAKVGLEKPSLAIGPLTLGPSLVLFWIQFYFYNVIALLTFCWAVTLVIRSYNCQHLTSARFNKILMPATKIGSFLLPVIFVTVPFAPIFEKKPMASLMVSCAPMMLCWTAGSICVITILIKYIYGIAKISRIANSTSIDISLDSPDDKSIHAAHVDKWLLLRFIIIFVAICTFEVLIINTAWARWEACKEIAARDGPDYSVSGTISSILTFLPGVTAGFVGFVVFGTTSRFRKIYAQNLRTCCGRRGGHERTQSVVVLEEGGGGAWKSMGSVRHAPTYHCRVESAGEGQVELAGMEEVGLKREASVRVQEMKRSLSKIREAREPEIERSTSKAREARKSSLKTHELQNSSSKAWEVRKSSLKAPDLHRSPSEIREARKSSLQTHQSQGSISKIRESRKSSLQTQELETPPSGARHVRQKSSYSKAWQTLGIDR